MSHLESHASMEELTAFSLGQLMGDEAAVVESHVSECDRCCQTLLDLSATADTFVQLLQEAQHEPDEQTHPFADPQQANAATDADAELPPELADHPRYKVIELVGVGGMGRVYRAEHRMMERTVALKVINRKMVNNEQAVERFHREVKAAAKLSHVNIVTAHDAEQAGDAHFLIMEYVEGIDLANVVKSRGALSIGEACDYVRQAASGLQHAHQQGMVHRDIKPHNLMLTADNTVKILDFGLASLSEVPIDRADTLAGRTDLTADGAIMGTPDYISPEQVTDARSVDGRSDIYSLGATFYFLLAGRPPFDAGSVTEVLQSHAEQEVERIDRVRDDVPVAVADVVARMMAKDPAERFQTPAELADVLAPFVEQHRADRPALAGKETPHRVKRAAIRSAAIVATLLLVAAALGILFTLNTGDVTVTPGAETKVAGRRNVRDETPSSAIKAVNNLKLVLIPAGTFTMGTPPRSKATPAEQRHQVTITTPFHMGVHEVTQQEYAWVMGNNPSSFCGSGERYESVADQDTTSFPVEGVSWEDAAEFCRRLTALPQSRRAGHAYRLPTEAEWEFACRAGTTTTFHVGDGLDGSHANVKLAWSKTEAEPPLNRTTATGSYDPNTFGLCDMHGNVWEWCSDWYSIDNYTNSRPINPAGPATGSSRVVRGGAWNFGAFYARSATREQRAPDFHDDNLGFRVVRVDKSHDVDASPVEANPARLRLH